MVFSSRTFRKKRKVQKKKRRTRRRAVQRGGNTYERSISPFAQVVNPMVWDDVRDGREPISYGVPV
jgi:hypothetical protein